MKKIVFVLTTLLLAASCSGEKRVILGDEQFDRYLPMLEGRRVAIFSNQTGIVGDKVLSGGIDERLERGQDRSLVPFGRPETGEHLLDALIDRGIEVTAIFSPEHGFRGSADAGEHVGSSVDPMTGVPILSLYGGGSNMPSEESMGRFDVLVIDIQDVGLRFYTYYITMMHLIDACAAYGREVIILDRPNPNGFYVDGPILDMDFKSGVGALPIPIVHGMTLGELARMMIGEGWLTDGRQAELTVIPCLNYTHHTRYSLILPPSPNLKDMKAVYLYASTCYFEGTDVSLGRGTDFPFEVYGHPDMPDEGFSFTPRSIPGAKTPPFLDRECHGVDLRQLPDERIWAEGINPGYVTDAYRKLGLGEDFFLRNRFFDLLFGTGRIRMGIMEGLDAAALKASWQADVESFKVQRKPYLLYEE